MSEERVFGYVRHDLYDAVVAERDALREGNRELAMQVMASDEQAQEAYGETLRLRAENEGLRAFAEECASYTCTCNAAFYDRGLVDPSCMSGEFGYDAQEVLGLPVTCKGILASRARRAALKADQ